VVVSVIGPRSKPPMLLALVLLATGCAIPPDREIARENAAIAARIDHRLGTSAGAGERMAFSRERPTGERVTCIDFTRDGSPPMRFIYRSGCLFTERDLPPAVFERWRRHFCEGS
jgi:hypothetical protein